VDEISSSTQFGVAEITSIDAEGTSGRRAIRSSSGKRTFSAGAAIEARMLTSPVALSRPYIAGELPQNE
jgi:hypothetical protein